MKRILFAVAIITAVPITARAGIYTTGTWTPYLTSDFGMTYSDVHFHGYDLSGFTGVFNIGAGLRNDRTRVQLTYQKRDTVSEIFSSWVSQTDASLDQQSLMAGVYYDLVQTGWFTTYVGASAGVNYYDFSLDYNDGRPSESESGYGFIGGVSAGVGLRISHISFTLGADYNYIARPRASSITPRVGLSLAF